MLFRKTIWVQSDDTVKCPMSGALDVTCHDLFLDISLLPYSRNFNCYSLLHYRCNAIYLINALQPYAVRAISFYNHKKST